MGKKKAPEGTKVRKEFYFELTQHEFAEKGKGAAALSKEIRELDSRFNEVKKDWQAKIKDREVQRDELLSVINEKKQKRIVESVLVKNFEAKEMEYWVEDETAGWTVIERRTMTPEEAQADLPLG